MKRFDSTMTIKEVIREAQEVSDIVKVSSKQIEDFVESGASSNTPIYEIILDEFTVIVDEDTVIFYVVAPKRDFVSACVIDGYGVEVGNLNIAADKRIIPDFIGNESKRTIGAIGYAGTVFTLVQRRLSKIEDGVEIEEKIARKKPYGKKNTRKGGRKVRLLKSYTLLRVEPVRVAHHHGKITCPCWGVRGHYRHYKSGKVIFIEAYQKGKDRSNYSPKEYVIFRKESDNENH